MALSCVVSNMTDCHPYLRLSIPSEAPFVLKPSTGKGWGGFATRPITKGSIIFTEKPWFTIQKPFFEIHEIDVKRHWSKLDSEQRWQFANIPWNGSASLSSKLEAFKQNSFSLNIDHHGVYPISSRFNHSCVPNATFPGTRRIHTARASQSLIATKDIPSGEEITFEYESDFAFRTTEERKIVQSFTCGCEACDPGSKFHYVSDMRRRLLRGLYYIGVGNDIDGKIDTSEAPIIANPELKQAAEQGRFSLAFIGSVAYLISLLLEAEGIGVDLIAQHYIQAAMGIALRANPLNMIWDPPSEFAVLEARKWMKRAGEIARFLRTPADQDMLDAFKQAEELFNSGNVTCAQYMAYQQQQGGSRGISPF